ncbi:4Fe-4S dicluster domain-containing protein [Bacteroidota bacterium]
MSDSINQKIFSAGIVGAGGAGFPSHIKAQSTVEFVLANGAECEPLIHKDYELMVNFAEEIVEGMKILMKETKAKQGFFGIKMKNSEAIEKVKAAIKDSNIELSLLGDFYPSGDEYELVYNATKRLIPPHGLPLDVGCVVNNVETLYNISRALSEKSVTDKFICVNGAVKNPSTFFTPIGTSIKEVLNHAGGPTIKDYSVLIGGILMGKLIHDLNDVITKTTAGIIVLPKNHYLVERMKRPIHDMNRIGKSACDQCSYCTEFCPRYLLGYDVQPHKVMRSLVFTRSGKKYWNQYADLCCSCGLCSLYACPEDLYPREACDQSKIELKKFGIRYDQKLPVRVHPIKKGRSVPLKQLMKKLDISKFDYPAPFNSDSPKPSNVRINFKQHIGKAAVPVVQKGDNLNRGDLIADIDSNDLGAKIHASINGRVIEINDNLIAISK